MSRLLEYRVDNTVINADNSNFEFTVKEAGVNSNVIGIIGGLINDDVNVQLQGSMIFVDDADGTTFGSGRKGGHEYKELVTV